MIHFLHHPCKRVAVQLFLNMHRSCASLRPRCTVHPEHKKPRPGPGFYYSSGLKNRLALTLAFIDFFELGVNDIIATGAC